jgi:hypothetical protein
MADRYKVPPSTQQQLPDATIPQLQRSGGGTATLPPPVTPPAGAADPVTPAAGAVAPVTPAAGAGPAQLTKQQQMLKMMQDAAAAMKARDATDAVLQQYMGTKLTSPSDVTSDPLTYKAPVTSGVPKK